MAKRNVFLKPNDIFSLSKMETLNVITIKPLEFMSTSIGTSLAGIQILLQGKPFEMVPFASIDTAENIGKFTVDTNNKILLFVDNTQIQTEQQARDYVWGLVVIYEMKELKVADNIPTYVCESFDSNGYQVSETLASPLPEVMNKIKCLDNILDINETGYYYHILTRNMN